MKIKRAIGFLAKHQIKNCQHQINPQMPRVPETLFLKTANSPFPEPGSLAFLVVGGLLGGGGGE